MLHEQQQRISIRSNIREWRNVLLVNESCPYQYSFYATGVGSGLATSVTLTQVSRKRFGESIYYAGADMFLISFLCRSMWLLLGCLLNSTPRIISKMPTNFHPVITLNATLNVLMTVILCRWKQQLKENKYAAKETANNMAFLSNTIKMSVPSIISHTHTHVART
jgi:uncharacterized protein with PQ loop repeat